MAHLNNGKRPKSPLAGFWHGRYDRIEHVYKLIEKDIAKGKGLIKSETLRAAIAQYLVSCKLDGNVGQTQRSLQAFSTMKIVRRSKDGQTYEWVAATTATETAQSTAPSTDKGKDNSTLIFVVGLPAIARSIQELLKDALVPLIVGNDLRRNLSALYAAATDGNKPSSKLVSQAVTQLSKGKILTAAHRGPATNWLRCHDVNVHKLEEILSTQGEENENKIEPPPNKEDKPIAKELTEEQVIAVVTELMKRKNTADQVIRGEFAKAVISSLGLCNDEVDDCLGRIEAQLHRRKLIKLERGLSDQYIHLTKASYDLLAPKPQPPKPPHRTTGSQAKFDLSTVAGAEKLEEWLTAEVTRLEKELAEAKIRFEDAKMLVSLKKRAADLEAKFSQ